MSSHCVPRITQCYAPCLRSPIAVASVFLIGLFIYVSTLGSVSLDPVGDVNVPFQEQRGEVLPRQNTSDSVAFPLKYENQSFINKPLGTIGLPGNKLRDGGRNNDELQESKSQIEALDSDCNLLDGDWVYDDAYPLWKDFSNPAFRFPMNCPLLGRNDTEYMKYRWKPKNCTLPKFGAKHLLETYRNQRLLFVGDSVGLAMYSSMVALLLEGLSFPKTQTSITSSKPKKPESIHYFTEFNTSVEYYVIRDTFLHKNGTSETSSKPRQLIHLEVLDPSWTESVAGSALIVFAGFDSMDQLLNGSIPVVNGTQQEEDFGDNEGVGVVTQALAEWAESQQKQKNPSRVFFLSHSPSHEDIDEMPCPSSRPSFGTVLMPGLDRVMTVEVVLNQLRSSATFLHISRLSFKRNDAHVTHGKHADCRNWCVPGVPDTWNLLLYASLFRKSPNSAITGLKNVENKSANESILAVGKKSENLGETKNGGIERVVAGESVAADKPVAAKKGEAKETEAMAESKVAVAAKSEIKPEAAKEDKNTQQRAQKPEKQKNGDRKQAEQSKGKAGSASNNKQVKRGDKKAEKPQHWSIPHFVDDPAAASKRPQLSLACNLYEGQWVYDPTYPVWTDHMNPLFSFDENCLWHGRTDSDFTRMRWQPRACSLPRFNASDFRRRMRGRRMLFVGDSLAEGAFSSMFAMAAHGADYSEIKKGPRPTKGRVVRRPYRAHFFERSNFTLEFFRSPTLAAETWNVARFNCSKKVKRVLQFESIGLDWSEPASSADIAVFNAGHYFNDGHTIRMGIYPSLNGVVYETGFDWELGFATVMREWAKWAQKQQRQGRQIFFRGYSPAHGSGRRRCPRVHPTVLAKPEQFFDPYTAVMKRILSEVEGAATLVDVTALSDVRNDAHLGKSLSKGRPDCSHWCTPGVADMWNELIYAELLRRKQPPFN